MTRAQPVRIGIVMDPIHSIKPYKDSTLAMMLAAASLGASLFYIQPDDLFIRDGRTFAYASSVEVFDDRQQWHRAGPREILPLRDLDIILMRKDPPVDKRFIHCCYLLEQAAREGVRVVNNPAALVALNEKLYATHFPELCPPTLITSDIDAIRDFLREFGKIIVKPLDAMGGEGVFMLTGDDVNFDVVWELETKRGTYPVVVQAFIERVTEGDRRVVVFNGQAYPHVLVRTPKPGSIRGNMAAGGSTHVRAISAREQEIVDVVAPSLIENGIQFAGLDVIGDNLIEINITSPTGLREIAKESGEDGALILMRSIIENI